MRKIGLAGRWFWALMAISSLTGAGFGQSAGSISGAVKDNNGAAVADAAVTIVNPANSLTQTARTNADGFFVSPQLQPGTDLITVEKAGFKKVEKTNIVLATGDKLNAGDFTLEVGDVTKAVQIQADAGQLQIKTESGERSDLVSGQQLRNIGLNGRNAIDLAKLVPGVISGGPASGSGASTVTNITGSFVINGTCSTQHEYTVDGVTNYNLGNNTGAPVSVNPDALEEVNITNGAGQTGAAIFNNYTGLTITNNVRSAGCSASQLGGCFGEYSAARDPCIIQLAAKRFF